MGKVNTVNLGSSYAPTKDELITYVKSVCGLNNTVVNQLVDDLDQYTTLNPAPYDAIKWALNAGNGVDEEAVIEKIDLYLGIDETVA